MLVGGEGGEELARPLATKYLSLQQYLASTPSCPVLPYLACLASLPARPALANLAAQSIEGVLTIARQLHTHRRLLRATANPSIDSEKRRR